MSLPGLVLGDFDLYDPFGLAAHGTAVLASGTSRGAPVPIETSMRSFLQNGAIVVTEGYDNRVVPIRVEFFDSDLVALAETEAALFAEIGKRNELVWTPVDGFGAPTLFSVVTSSFEQVDDDDADVLEGEAQPSRYYQLRLVCAPFVYSATETVTAALAASGSTTTLVDNMSATTNWTGTVNGASVSPATAGGALSVTSSALTGLVPITMTRTASITTSSTKYLVVDWKVAAGTVSTDGLSALGDGIRLDMISTGPSPTAGYTRTAFYAPTSPIAVLQFGVVTRSTNIHAGIPIVRSLTLDNLDRTDVRPYIGTARQQLRVIEVGGSAPTIGSLAVEHNSGSAALGDVLVYTCPDDGSAYVPACRPYRASGPAPVADAANTVSGFYDLIDTATSYAIPVTDTPEGEYLIVIRAARPAGAASASVTWEYRGQMNAVSIGSTATATYTGAFTTAYTFHRLGMIHLPLWDMAPGPTAMNLFSIVATNPGTDDIRLDEFYLFNMTTGRLTQVACGTAAPSAGGASNRLWVDSPSIDNDGMGRYLRGFAADQSDAFSAYSGMTTPGVHEFTPPSVKVFTVTTNPTTEASASFRHHEAWHTHAGA